MTNASVVYREKATVLDVLLLDRTLTRLAHQILEHQKDIRHTVLLGIRSRGDVLARRLAAKIAQIEQVQLPVGAVDISRHRDDLKNGRANGHSGSSAPTSSIPGSLEGKEVILVDDVLFTGRSVRAALDALVEYGRPSRIQLAVLVDRGHREFPIRADYIGKNVPTSLREDIQVKLMEVDGEDKVVIREAL